MIEQLTCKNTRCKWHSLAHVKCLEDCLYPAHWHCKKRRYGILDEKGTCTDFEIKEPTLDDVKKMLSSYIDYLKETQRYESTMLKVYIKDIGLKL